MTAQRTKGGLAIRKLPSGEMPLHHAAGMNAQRVPPAPIRHPPSERAMSARLLHATVVTPLLVLLGSACSGDGPGYKDPILGGVPTAQVRIVNAAPAIASAQMFVAGTAVGPTVARGTSSFDCQTVAVGQPITFRANGTDTTLATIAAPEMTGGGNYTIVFWGPAPELKATVLSDQDLPAASSTVTGIRFFNATSAAGDVYVTFPDAELPQTPSVQNLQVGQYTEGGGLFAQYPLTSTLVRMFDVGVRTGTPRITASVSQTALSSVRNWTMILTEATGISGENLSFLVAPCGA